MSILGLFGLDFLVPQEASLIATTLEPANEKTGDVDDSWVD